MGSIYNHGKNKMKVIAIIQARMNSTRLPQKIMTNLCGKPMLWHIVRRVEKSKTIENVLIATSVNKEDDIVKEFAESNNIMFWRGSQDNVLERFYESASYCHADIIVRLTGDNALIDSGIIDAGVTFFRENKYDYVYYREGLPLGVAVEIFTYDALEYAYKNVNDTQCLEHVTPYFYQNPHIFSVKRVPCIGKNYNNLRWTMDTEFDKKLITEIYECLYENNNDFTYGDVLKEYNKHPQWIALNDRVEQIQVTYPGERIL